jgi:hypothetical protein
MAKSRRNKSRRRKQSRLKKKLTRTKNTLSTRAKLLNLGLISTNALRDANKRTRVKNPAIHDKMKRRKRILRTVRKRKARLEGLNRLSKPLSPLGVDVTYNQNKKNTICRIRAVRTEVLHALKKTGKSGQKKPIRRNPNIICKRSK